MKKHIYLIFFAFLLILVPNVQAGLGDGLVHYWELDENSGTFALDELGINNATATNAGVFTSGTAGIENDPADFIGNSYFVNTTGTVTSAPHFTINFWMYRDSSAGDIEIPLSRYEGSTNGHWYFDESGRYFTVRIGGAAESVDINYYPEKAKWHMLTGVVNGTDVVYYINGTEVGKNSYSGDLINASLDLYIGARNLGGSERYFDGVVDEVAFWNRNLSAEEVSDLYNSGLGSFYPYGSDSPNVSVSLNYPSDGATFSGDSITLNASYTSSNNYNLTNATYTIWHDNRTLFNQTVIYINGTSNSTSLETFNYILDGYIWNVETCATNGTVTDCEINENNLTYSWRPINEVSQFYVNYTYDTSVERFNVVINTTNSVPLLTASLVYNGTYYSSTKTESGTLSTFETDISIPVVYSPQNHSFYWEVKIIDSDSNEFLFNSTFNNHTVDPSNITRLCGTQVINYTTFEESNQTLLNTDFDARFEWRLNQSSTVKKNITFSLGGNNEYDFCLNTNRTFYTDIDIELDAPLYASRSFAFHNQELTNVTSHQQLYLLNSSLGTNFDLYLKDAGLFPLSNYTIKIYRKVLSGADILVENDITDFAGKMVARVIEDIPKYRVLIYNEQNSLVKSTNIARFICSSTFCSETYVIQELTGSFDDFDDLTDHTFSLTFNNNTNTFNYVWTDNRGESETHRLLIEKRTFSGGKTVVYNGTSTADSDVLTYTTDGTNATYIASAFRRVGDDEDRLDILTVEVGGDYTDTYGFEGLYWGFILFMLMLLVGRFYPPVGIILYLFSALMLGLFDIVFINPAIMVASIVIGVIFIWAWRR